MPNDDFISNFLEKKYFSGKFDTETPEEMQYRINTQKIDVQKELLKQQGFTMPDTDFDETRKYVRLRNKRNKNY